MTKKEYEILKKIERLEFELINLKKEYRVGYILINGRNVPFDQVIWTKRGKPVKKTILNQILNRIAFKFN
jgi:hypothetical protein